MCEGNRPIAAPDHTRLVNSSAHALNCGALARALCGVPAMTLDVAWEAALLLSVIAVGGYAGSLVRVGFQYYKAWRGPEANFNVVYANVVGSFIMGVASVFQAAATRAGQRSLRIKR